MTETSAPAEQAVFAACDRDRLELARRACSGPEGAASAAAEAGVDARVLGTPLLGWAVQGSCGNPASRAATFELLRLGADPNSLVPDGNPCLVEAVWNCDFELVRALIDAGAYPDARRSDAGAARSLTGAIQTDDSCALAEFLLSRGASPRPVGDEDRSPLECAAERGSTKALSMLVAAGADPNRGGTLGRRPLQSALRSGSISAARLLVELGADPSLLESDGTCVVSAAANSNSVPCIRFAAKLAFESSSKASVSGKATSSTFDEAVVENFASYWSLHEFGIADEATRASALSEAAGVGDWRMVSCILSAALIDGKSPAPEVLLSLLVCGARSGVRASDAREDRDALRFACELCLCMGAMDKSSNLSDAFNRLFCNACSCGSPEPLEALLAQGVRPVLDGSVTPRDCLARLIGDWDDDEGPGTTEGDARERCLRALWQSGVSSDRAAEALAQASEPGRRHVYRLLLSLVEHRELSEIISAAPIRSQSL